MNRFKRWIHATWITVAAGLGVQYVRPPVLDTSTPPAVVHVLTSPTPSVTGVVPVPTVMPTPVADAQLERPLAVMGKVTGATKQELVLLTKAQDEANQVLRSDCFKAAMLVYGYTERNLFETTKNLSNMEIYSTFSAKPIPFDVNIFDGSWYQNYVSKTMGYDVGDGVVYMNRFYADTAEIMGSLEIHELAHALGFHHYQNYSTTVPYKNNDFFDDCRGKP